jgi:hypothetical protein
LGAGQHRAERGERRKLQTFAIVPGGSSFQDFERALKQMASFRHRRACGALLGGLGVVPSRLFEKPGTFRVLR